MGVIAPYVAGTPVEWSPKMRDGYVYTVVPASAGVKVLNAAYRDNGRLACQPVGESGDAHLSEITA
jgi:hypothetical protein